VILKAFGSTSVIFDCCCEACETGGVGCGNWTCSEVSGPSCSSATSSVGGTLLGSIVEESVFSSTEAVVMITFVVDDWSVKNGCRARLSQGLGLCQSPYRDAIKA